jgi:hypothetical protein
MEETVVMMAAEAVVVMVLLALRAIYMESEMEFMIVKCNVLMLRAQNPGLEMVVTVMVHGGCI